MEKTNEKLRLQVQGSPNGIEVLAITAGIGNGWEFSPGCLQASLPLWEGAECYADHLSAQEGKPDQHSVRDLGGLLKDVLWDMEATGIRATLNPTGPAAAVFVELARAAIAHPELAVGLSADILMQVDGKKVLKIVRVKSLDAVTHPARGGKFVRVLQGEQPPAGQPDETTRQCNHQFESERKEEIMEDEKKDQGKDEGTSRGPATRLETNVQSPTRMMEQVKRQAQLQEAVKRSDETLAATCGFLLTAALQASRLPEVVKTRLQKTYAGTVFEPEQLQNAIEEARAEVSALTGGLSVLGPGRISSMVSAEDQLKAAVFDLFGEERDPELKNVKAARLSGLRELYLGLTGDYDLHGGLDLAHAQFQLSTTNFTTLVKNALNKALIRHWDGFGNAGYNWWKPIVSVEHFDSLNDVTWMLFGTVGSLPTVAEGAEYTPLVIADNGETSSFIKKGGYVGLTLEAIDRDNIGALKQMPKELAFAAIRELSGLISAIFTANSGVGPTLADTGALFNATAVSTAGGHKNLLTTALGTDYSAWEAMAGAMYAQPMLVSNGTGYIGTGKPMALDPKYCLVPRALRGQANNLFLNRQNGYGVDNMWYGQVLPITVPDWTDVTDWAAVADPAIMPGIMVGERFGLVPQVFVAGNDTDPAVFMNDESRIKVRSFLAVGVADFRPLAKNNVAG